MPGTIIHEGALLGAGSFAKGELESWTIYAGSPAKPIKKRIPPTGEHCNIAEEYYDRSSPVFDFIIKE